MNGERPGGKPWIGILLILLFFGMSFARKGAEWILDYFWWQEVGQLETWWSTVYYTTAPLLVVMVVAFVVLWVAHARGIKAAGSGMGSYPRYAKISTLVLLGVSYLAAAAVTNEWAIVLFLGGRKAATQANPWVDPVFQKPLSYYFFNLPFYEMLLGVVLAISFLAGVVYLASMFLWLARERTPRLSPDGSIQLPEFDVDVVGTLKHSIFLHVLGTVFLLALAAQRYLDRYDLLTADHGFMVGVDYIDETIRLPLRWVTIGGVLLAILLIRLHRFVLAVVVLIGPMLVESVVPQIVHAVYVRPNEISLQKPYIQRHIGATRTAYGLDRRSKEVEYKARMDARVDLAKHKEMFDNVRLWDWRAFHDTVTQIQALRPYYVFHDTDVDRYKINGQLQQVLLTPREIDVRQLSADARGRWMNPHFIYTHGYGVVLAEANRLTSDGMPLLHIQNAPPEIKAADVKLTRPEIYYGEVVHEPVFVRTAQPEFNYPSGAENVHTRYEGKGGFPMSSLPMRFTAALAQADWNIVLTGFLTPESRMMIRRNVRERVQELAGFLMWDTDPYLVLTPAGKLMWMIDGYTTSNAHPYASRVALGRGNRANYVRNSVKATVDAYDGEVNLYVFDPTDPIVEAYSHLFPKLLKKAEEMPAELREHVRYPEVLFRLQAEIYRNFHMKDAEAFYNKEDSWDLARYANTQDGNAQAAAPTYVMATLPGETKPEFLLMIPFTPRNKDNLIGVMIARCDGEKLGELVFLQLSKQELVFGPLQIDARINQDSNISKDLTLWNQQGSRVLRGQMLALPVDDTFVYVAPIYIQASEARMPQLKKVAIAVGNSLVYAETYEQALAQLGGLRPTATAAAAPAAATPGGAPAAATPGGASEFEKKLDQARRHVLRYRELSGQGKYVEAAKELEALEALTKR